MRKQSILVAVVVFFVSVSPVMAVIVFKDGLAHDIDYLIKDYVSVGLKTTLNILDGATIPPDFQIIAREDSIIKMFGGSVFALCAFDSSQITVSGGSIDLELHANSAGIFMIHGSDFAVDGTLVGYTELYSILGGNSWDETYRQLTGTLLSGETINNRFIIGNNAKIVLIPEPATILLLGLGGIGLIRKRKK